MTLAAVATALGGPENFLNHVISNVWFALVVKVVVLMGFVLVVSVLSKVVH